MICKNCNASIRDGAVFCPSCGKEAGLNAIINDALSKKCLQCGAENSPEAKFCRVDGWRFPESEPEMKPAALQESQGERVCPTCGTSNPAGAKFCRNDGSPLDPADHPSLAPESGVEEKASEQVKIEKEIEATELEPAMKPAAEQESQSERVCPTCGTLNAAGARFCKNDASPLDSADHASLAPELGIEEKVVEQTTIWPEKEALKTNANEAGNKRSWMYLAVPLAVLCVAAVAVYWLFPRTPAGQTPKPLPESAIVVPGGETPGTIPESAAVAPGDQTSQPTPENTVPAPDVDLPRLEGQINRALREAGIDGVTAQVNDAAVVTLKGVVKGVQGQQKALEIVKTFKGVSQVNDIIFIIEK
ncbi:MAG: zinc-ribbon domain-containing protein [Smithellaceae bacterium]